MSNFTKLIWYNLDQQTKFDNYANGLIHSLIMLIDSLKMLLIDL